MAHNYYWLLLQHQERYSKVYNFIQYMIFIINIVSMSPKRNNKLLDNQTSEIIHDIELGESDTGKGANQIGSLQKLGDNG
jgi:hypothetical protein